MNTRPNNHGPAIVIAVGIILVAAAGILLAASPDGDPISANGPARAGSALGNFTLSDLTGARVSLADYRGRPVLINAWATWCPPCRAEMPMLNDYYLAHQNQGLVLLAINAGETRQQAGDFARQLGLTFQVLLDQDESLMDRLQIFDFPTSILVGKDGVVRAVHTGLLTPEIIAKEITPFLSK